jgi:hypothetical protein
MRNARATAIAATWLALSSPFCDCALGAPIAGVSTPVGLGCRFRVTPDKFFIRLEAIAWTQAAVSGRYALTIVKQSASGSSRNIQSGTYHLGPKGTRVLTTTILDASALGHYQAHLSLQSEYGSVSCSSP